MIDRPRPAADARDENLVTTSPYAQNARALVLVENYKIAG